MQSRSAILILISALPLLLLLSGASVAASVEVRVLGVTGSVLRNVEAHLAIRELVGRTGESAPTVAEVRRRHRRAPADIEAALQALGYYDSTIAGTLERQAPAASKRKDVAAVPPDGKTPTRATQQEKSPKNAASVESRWIAQYRIERGAPTRWRHIQLELLGDAQDNHILADSLRSLLPVSGKRVHHGRYDQSRSGLIDQLADSGYLDAEYIRSELRVERALQVADIDWVVDSGSQFAFGEISIDQSVLDPEFVSKYVLIRPGQTFDARRIADLQLRLGASGYFSDVTAHVDRDAEREGRVPVRLTASPAQSKFFRVGAGFGTDTGPRLTLGAELRRLNRSGHRLRMDLRAAIVRSSAGMEYLIPWRDVTTDVVKIYGQVDRGDIGDAQSDQYTSGVRLEDDWLFGLRRARYVQLSHESFQFDREPGRQADLLMPGFSLTLQRGDDLLFTRRGVSAALEVHGGLGDVVSDTSFIHATMRASLVVPLGTTSRLILRGGLGAVEATDFNALPPSQRFFIGGDRTLRGYAFESISAENRTGIDIGGSRFFSQSVEADTLVWRDFGVAAFFDQGGAGRSFFGTRKQSVGIGFRWKSPVGMLRVDVAHPLDGSGGVRFHLGLGPDL